MLGRRRTLTLYRFHLDYTGVLSWGSLRYEQTVAIYGPYSVVGHAPAEKDVRQQDVALIIGRSPKLHPLSLGQGSHDGGNLHTFQRVAYHQRGGNLASLRPALGLKGYLGLNGAFIDAWDVVGGDTDELGHFSAEAVRAGPTSPGGTSAGDSERQPYHRPVLERLMRMRSRSLILICSPYLVYPQTATITRPRRRLSGHFCGCYRGLPTLAFLAFYGTTRNTASSPHCSLFSNHSG